MHWHYTNLHLLNNNNTNKTKHVLKKSRVTTNEITDMNNQYTQINHWPILKQKSNTVTVCRASKQKQSPQRQTRIKREQTTFKIIQSLSSMVTGLRPATLLFDVGLLFEQLRERRPSSKPTRYDLMALLFDGTLVLRQNSCVGILPGNEPASGNNNQAKLS